MSNKVTLRSRNQILGIAVVLPVIFASLIAFSTSGFQPSGVIAAFLYMAYGYLLSLILGWPIFSALTHNGSYSLGIMILFGGLIVSVPTTGFSFFGLTNYHDFQLAEAVLVTHGEITNEGYLYLLKDWVRAFLIGSIYAGVFGVVVRNPASRQERNQPSS